MAEFGLLGRIICGTMRMVDVERSVPEWVEFLAYLHDRSITTLHSSAEYDSFPLLCQVLAAFRQQYPKKQFQHVVKLAVPHFQETGFSATQLNTKVAEYCQQLHITTIDIVQWMWRADLEQDAARCQNFAVQSPEIAQAVAELKATHSIRQFMCFPYTQDFAEQALKYDFVDGLMAYHNHLEPEYENAFAQVASLNKVGIAIRPFAAGQAFNNGLSAMQLLDNTLQKSGIDHVVVGLSSQAHVEAITC